MSISVLSALARLDLDPWLEAANLARMTNEAASERLTLLISSLPERPAALLDPGAIADRLIALLQHGSHSAAPSTAPLRVSGPTYSQVAIFMMLMTFLLSTQFFMGSRQSASEGEGARAQGSSAVSPQTSSRR
jgi:hypothetical protein